MARSSEYRLDYRSDIEGLRALAVLLVVGVHAGVPWLSGGFVGVDIFFVLSGFLITGLIVQEVTRTGQLRFIDFYLRRFRRLLPALILMLLGSGLLASVLLAPGQQMQQAIAGATASAWLSNIHFAFQKLDYFAAGNESNIYLHTWSLGVEEQFYLIWPALVYVLLRYKDHASGVSHLRLGMIAVGVISLFASIFATYRFPQFAFYMMPLRAWQFALGALVWLEFRERPGGLLAWMQGSRMRSATAGWLGLALLLGTGLLSGSNQPYPGFLALIRWP